MVEIKPEQIKRIEGTTRYYERMKGRSFCTRIRPPEVCIDECFRYPDTEFYGNWEEWCLACPYATDEKRTESFSEFKASYNKNR